MEITHLAQLSLLLLLSAGYVFFQLWKWRRPRRPIRVADGVQHFEVEAASSVYLPLLSKLIRPETIVIVPSGDGLYLNRLDIAARRRVEDRFKAWCRRGAHLHFVVSSPNQWAHSHYAALKRRCGENLHVYLLEREAATPTDRTEIERLDTFHPIIAARREAGELRPLAMWLENYHPLDSRAVAACL